MGSILNPNNDDFNNLVSIQSNLYVDKTDFISETIKQIDSEGRYICFTRPRRFGKTITAKMLSAYYSKGCDSKELFANLKIAQDPSYLTHLNQYNVIYIDMNFIQQKYESFNSNPLRSKKTNFIKDIVDYLNFLTAQDILENEDYAKIVKSKNDTVNPYNIADVVNAIRNKTSENFIFIMDEWDLIYREYKDNTKLQEKFINLLRGLFKADNKFSLAYLTGILPIKKYISQSALNNFDEYNMLRPTPYERFFGFTEEEVEVLAKEHNMNFAELKRWYDGYKLNGTSILNPNSVIKAISNKCIQSYWSETSAIDSFRLLINMNFAGLKDEIYEMVVNKSEIYFNSFTFQNDMVSISYKDDVYSLLVCLGYIASRRTGSENDKEYYAYIPNEEIRISLYNLIIKEDWYPQIHRMKQSQELYRATCSLNSQKVAEIIESIHTSPVISVDSYNSELSLSYCITYGYSQAIEHNYNIIKEKPTGKGYADIIFEPKLDSTLPVLIVELKYGKSASEAIEQIKERQYANHYVGEYDRVLLVGINYDKITKKHECLIEEIVQ